MTALFFKLLFFSLNNYTYKLIKPDKFKCLTLFALVDKMRDVYFGNRAIDLVNLACDISSNSPRCCSVNSLRAPEGSTTLKQLCSWFYYISEFFPLSRDLTWNHNWLYWSRKPHADPFYDNLYERRWQSQGLILWTGTEWQHPAYRSSLAGNRLPHFIPHGSLFRLFPRKKGKWNMSPMILKKKKPKTHNVVSQHDRYYSKKWFFRFLFHSLTQWLFISRKIKAALLS